MRKEAKIVKTSPEFEQTSIENWEAFGWELLSTQEILAKESHLEDAGGGAVDSVITTTNYVKLAFNRDVNIKNKQELDELQEEYSKLKLTSEKLPSLAGWAFFVFFLMFVDIFLMASGKIEMKIGIFIMLFIGLIGLFIIQSVKLSNIKKVNEINKEKMQVLMAKRKVIVDEARAILDKNEQEEKQN